MEPKDELWALVAANQTWFEDQYEWARDLDDDHPERRLLTGILNLLEAQR